METTAVKPARRYVVEVDAETRHRLKIIAAKRDISVKRLIGELAERADPFVDVRPGAAPRGQD